MATFLGTLGPFDPDSEDWTCYCERLEQFVGVNGIDNADKKRAVLLSSCGSAVYQVIRNLVAPEKPADKSFSELVKLVRDHYCPPPSVTVQRYNFNSRTQKEGETVSQFVAELRRLSEHCDFKATLDDMLRDRIVCGVRNSSVQRRLLAESGLTFKKAFELVQSAESAEKNATEIQRSVTVAVNAVQKTSEIRPLCAIIVANKARVCRSPKVSGAKGRGRGSTRGSAAVQQVNLPPVEGEETYTLFTLSREGFRAPLTIDVVADGVQLSMEVDTGAVASIISECTYRRQWSKQKRPLLQRTDVHLRTYTGEKINIKGKISLSVQYDNETLSLDLLVVEGDGPSLMGRDWLSKLKPNLSVFYAGNPGIDKGVEKLLDRYADLFKEELGRVKGVEVKIHVDESARPRFFRPRPVPFALKGRIEEELERLQRDGIIEPVKFSEWAAPVVPVLKSDGSLRLCGDYKVTVNSVANVESYPYPRINDLLASLTGGKVFSKLDLSHAYLQLPLDEKSKEYVTITTHKGLFRYNRMPFGVASAPAIFQRTMERILQGIPHVHVYIDNILVADSTEKEHLVTLEKVMSRLGECGIKLKRTKRGNQPTKEKCRAIVDAPVPEDISQLKSFWGLVNYYAKFLPCLADTLAPLYKLLTKHQPWSWGADQAAAFQKAKFQLTSDVLLVHFDPSKKIALSCDASPYGIGVVLSHLQEDGSGRPIAYASRSLAPAEKNYSQIEKEGLAVVWGVKKFHQFLFGRQFVVYSDHKPLQFLFSETKPVPTMASSRIQRWALTLSAYNYQMVFRPGKNQGNADGLSRLPLAEAPEEVPTPGDTILMLQAFSDMSSVVTATSIRRWTDKDPVLSVVRRMVLHGWRTQSNEQFKPYECRKSELSVEDGCILWGSRVVVPPPGRVPIIKILHDGHPGVSRMKSLARSVVWWPGLDAELEAKVKSCEACQVNSRSPPKSPLHPWEWPTKPWSRIHVDFCGPFLGKIIFFMVDAHSKWLEAAVVSSTSSQQAIRVLRQVFSCHGLPEVLVSDNGTAFTSTEFQTFVQCNGFRHIRSAPYHPATNGLAERAVQTVKNALRKTAGDIDTCLSRFLFQYRLTPHSTTGRSPAELLLGRKPRSHLDFIFPSVEHHVTKNQGRQKENHDVHTRQRSFQVGEEVYVLNHRGMIPGKVTAVRGPLTLIVTLDDGTESRYHVDHVKERITGGKRDSGTFQQPELDPLPTIVTMADRQAELPQAPAPPIAEVEPDPDPLEEEAPPVADLEAVPLLPRRSTRPHRPPERYGL
ncbi:hypothetical protein EMCRGX_G031528 [Ephydatia muelleri]